MTKCFSVEEYICNRRQVSQNIIILALNWAINIYMLQKMWLIWTMVDYPCTANSFKIFSWSPLVLILCVLSNRNGISVVILSRYLSEKKYLWNDGLTYLKRGQRNLNKFRCLTVQLLVIDILYCRIQRPHLGAFFYRL